MEDLKAEVRQMQLEVQKLRSVIVSVIGSDSKSDSPNETAAPGRRRLQTSGGGNEKAEISWDGESLNFQSTAEGKSTKVSILGDLNITGDIYLNGELLQDAVPSPAPTPAPSTPAPTCSSGTAATQSASWISDTGEYSSAVVGANVPSRTVDGTTNQWLGDSNVAEIYLIYDLGSVVPIEGIQIGNGQDIYGVQETLLQSKTSLTGPWTTESTFTGASRAANRTRCVCFAFNVPV
jgi:hypothetical protein